MAISQFSTHDAEGNPVSRDADGNVLSPERTPQQTSRNMRLTEAQLTEARADFAKAGKLEDFEHALRADGYEVPAAPVDPRVQREHDEAGLSLVPKPTDYQVDISRVRDQVGPDRASNVIEVATRMAADMQLGSHMGKGFIEHLADLGQQHRNMSAEQKSVWEAQQEKFGARRFGSKNYAEMKIKAMEVLKLAKPFKTSRGNIEDLAGFIRDGAVGKSWWLVSTLATHADTVALVNNRLAAKGLKR